MEPFLYVKLGVPHGTVLFAVDAMVEGRVEL